MPQTVGRLSQKGDGGLSPHEAMGKHALRAGAGRGGERTTRELRVMSTREEGAGL